MVKQFIKGLLGKKEEKSTEEVPDELPPLVEDTLKKEEEKPTKKEEKGSEKATDGLPPLEEKQPGEEEDLLKEFEKYKEEFKWKKEKPEEEEEKQKIRGFPTSLSKEAEEKETIVPNSSSTSEQILYPNPHGKPEVSELLNQRLGKAQTIEKPYIEQHKFEKEEEGGFFSELLSITQEQGINESVLKQDLFKRMKDHWYFHPQEKEKFKNREQIQQDLFGELSQLKRLEERWTAQKKFIEEDKRVLLEKEREIETKTEKLQKILNQLDFYKDVPLDKHFLLNNGMAAKNLHELMNLIEIIDDKTFNYHVNKKRNDFSEWVKDVVRNEELAKKVGAAKTREEILVILENASMGNVYGIDPEKYFRMNNGRVINGIKELIFVLKEINEQVFRSHVNNEKNDFSAWIRDTFKNDYLADKLQTIKSKEDTIKALEDFFKV